MRSRKFLLARRRHLRVQQKSGPTFSTESTNTPLFQFNDIFELASEIFEENFEQGEINEIAKLWEEIEMVQFITNVEKNVIQS